MNIEQFQCAYRKGYLLGFTIALSIAFTLIVINNMRLEWKIEQKNEIISKLIDRCDNK